MLDIDGLNPHEPSQRLPKESQQPPKAMAPKTTSAQRGAELKRAT
jgi:hypothetical protein